MAFYEPFFGLISGNFSDFLICKFRLLYIQKKLIITFFDCFVHVYTWVFCGFEFFDLFVGLYSMSLVVVKKLVL